MFNYSKAAEMKNFLNKTKRKNPKPTTAYKLADEQGRGVEAIQMQKIKKK